MNIGIFLPHFSLNRIQHILREYNEVNFHYYPYQTIEDLKAVYQANKDHLDAYFFSGQLAYMTALSDGETYPKPAYYMKMSEADFYRKLFKILLEHPHLDLSRVFIDFYQESEIIQRFVEELPVDKRPIITKDLTEYSMDDIYNESIKYHEKLHASGKIDWSFTRFVNTLEDFDNKGINYFHFEISDETIIQTANEMINAVRIDHLKSNQIVYGYLTFEFDNASLLESKFLAIHSKLLEYNYHMKNQLIIDASKNYFEITTNRSVLENMTNNFASCDLLPYLSKEDSTIFHLGWGTGRNFTEAQINAKRASRISESNQLSSTYILLEDEQLVGPLTGAQHNETPARQLLKMVSMDTLRERLNMSNDRIHKVLLAFDQVNLKELTSSDFASLLQISDRSANRILKEAEENGLVTVKDDRESGLQGRPRKFYVLNEGLL
ncbi:hypothetical protein QWT69_03290 [Sporosarcina oncorhynchi]|uniref:HTH domain-containing protein n=1 Tax=Sporosarcina oncorhynchi TaxID=3056444 RepID=A0ABZ0L6G9_9BACL|nr:hypothetical protein [Sporosarcina sp. T2O-4]WOV88164.1 hypothetical protein QWT69_03290 [Sporosarcina sp. T2O-4]